MKISFLTLLACMLWGLSFFYTVSHKKNILSLQSINGLNKNIHSENDSELFQELKLNELNLSKQAFEMAFQGFQSLLKKGMITNSKVLSIIDFSQPSTGKRLYVIDLNLKKLLFNTYVAHGQNSGKLVPENFSNEPNSYESSLGFYTTNKTYLGKHGYSLLLNGLEKGINDLAQARAIVFHGASYVSEEFVKTYGYLGRSWGCPAVPENIATPIIDCIKDGSCLFIYANKQSYLTSSKILNT